MTSGPVSLSLGDVRGLAERALTSSGCSAGNAASQARAVVGAERDGIKSHGLAYVPIYCEHLKCGKVKGDARPAVTALSASAFACNADDGFALPAIDALFDRLVTAAKETGIAAGAIRNSYNCGVLGQHVEILAEAGLLGLGFTNAPASIAPPGGKKPVIGTNPFALGVPDGEGAAAFVIDQSSSVIAKSEISLRAKQGEPIPEGWALDAEGRPTRDAAAALAGSMLPAGGYKGFGIGLTVEVFAAALSGATLGLEASSFATNDGGPPRTGQFFFALDPERFAGGAFGDRVAALTAAVQEQEGARLPGGKRRAARERIEAEGVTVAPALYERVLSYCES
ncbi:MAG: Ldh family oxidoreductase [Kiloniellales bacterium]|nr:Ldh family oxidoreductase [Kiloniellales bacterium]